MNARSGMGTNMRVSLVFLTYNRKEIVQQSVTHNLKNAGASIEEIIWVDNGSTDGVRDFMMSLEPDVAVLNKTNLGVAKGYNRGHALATGDAICIIGVDRLMPDGWLAAFKEWLEAVPGVACMYYRNIRDFTSSENRWRGDQQMINNHLVQPCLTLGARILLRETWLKVGFYREDLGLYGLEDTEWGERAIARGIFSYVIPGYITDHSIGDDVGDTSEYRKMKWRELYDKEKFKRFQAAAIAGYPYYNPYALCDETQKKT